MRCPTAIALATTALLGGCANYAPAPVVLEAAAADQDTRRIDPEAVRGQLLKLAPAYEWNAQEWNRLTLFAAALTTSPEVAEAKAHLEAAEADIRAARVRPGPTLTLTAEYAFNPAEASPWLLGAASDMRRTAEIKEYPENL